MSTTKKILHICLIALSIAPATTAQTKATTTPNPRTEEIKAYCLDYNWAPTGRRRKPFANPGHWAASDPAEHVAWYKAMGANVIQTFAVSTNGYAWYKNSFAPEQPGLKHDFLTEVVKLGHQENMKVFGYFCAASNPLWAKLHPELSYGSPTTYHIPYTDEYLEYFSKSIHDAVKKTGMDGFMVDWLWMPNRKSTKGKWLECEKNLYKQLMGKEFPGEDKLSKADDLAYSRKSLERCWDAIRKAAKSANPDCIVWLTVNKMLHPHVTNSKIYKEADWLMNEAGSVKAIRKAKPMVGKHTRLITCLAVWNGADASTIVPEALKEGIGLYGFTTPRSNSGTVNLENIFKKQVTELAGDAKSIAVLARAYKGKSEYAVWKDKQFIETKNAPTFRLSIPRRGRGLQDTAHIKKTKDNYEITINTPYNWGSAVLNRKENKWPESITLNFQHRPNTSANFPHFGITNGKTGIKIFTSEAAKSTIGQIDPKIRTRGRIGFQFGFKNDGKKIKVKATKTKESIRITIPNEIIKENPNSLKFTWGA